MYLISLYFDEQTNHIIQNLMNKICKKTGNDSMMYIPPHITLASFSSDNAKEIFSQIEAKEMELEFVSIGYFLPSVCFLQPILSLELEQLMEEVHTHIDKCSNKYQPNHWITHITLCKYIKSEELSSTLEAIQNEFKPFKGKVVKIGLAKSNPYTDILVKTLK